MMRGVLVRWVVFDGAGGRKEVREGKGGWRRVVIELMRWLWGVG